MLSRFISKSLHLRLFTLLSPETHVLNPKSSFPHFLLNNSCFFSTGNNNGKDSDYERIDNQVLHDGSWAKEQGFKPWNFDMEGKEERLFDVGEEVNVGTEMKGFQVEKKFLQSEEKALKGISFKSLFQIVLL